MFVILASWKFCVEKNCDQGLGNVAATPAYNLLIYLSLPKFCNTIKLLSFSGHKVHSVNAVNYDKLIIFNEIIIVPTFLV